MKQIYGLVQVRALELRDFRRYEHALLEFPTEGVAFVGPNAAGKTSFLEALHKVALLRGFGKEEEMVRWGKRGYRLRVRLSTGTAEVSYEQGKGTRVVWEGEAITPLARWIGRIPVVLLRPGDSEWIEGPAAVRRRWADRLLSQVSSTYLGTLMQYERALAQRNALLGQPDSTPALLDSWEALLVETGPFLQRMRLQLAPLLEDSLRTFYGCFGPEKIHLHYKTTVDPSPEAWRKAWSHLRPKEVHVGRTLIGPHLEDFQVQLGEQPARGYASEGQKKSLLIALKWAELQHLKGQQTFSPLLLLDDVGEKLDKPRLEALGQLTRLAGQTFVTDVEERRVREAFPELPIVRLPLMS
ncbi:MAG: DNA replication and repair protein RecF [Bacteroidia bacterium]|nr:DNA replication and repair protein RecF [Bacteroidia bacterium]